MTTESLNHITNRDKLKYFCSSMEEDEKLIYEEEKHRYLRTYKIYCDDIMESVERFGNDKMLHLIWISTIAILYV